MVVPEGNQSEPDLIDQALSMVGDVVLDQLFIITASAAEAREHVRLSIENGVATEIVMKHFNSKELSKMGARSSDGQYYAWGAVPGPRNSGNWDRMQKGAYVLLYQQGYFTYMSRVIAKHRNKQFALDLWGTDENDNTWEFAYFLKRPISLSVSADKLYRFIGTNHRGFRQVTEGAVQGIKTRYGTLEQFMRNLVQGTVESVKSQGTSSDNDKQSSENKPDAVATMGFTDIEALVPTKRDKGSSSSSRIGWARHSADSTLIGERAEKLVHELLEKHAKELDVHELRWMSKEGEKPGWDIQYQDSGGTLIAVEVKGTTGSVIASVEMTRGEWKAAEALGERYWIYLVIGCLDPGARIARVQNPCKMVSEQKWSIEPSRWQLRL